MNTGSRVPATHCARCWTNSISFMRATAAVRSDFAGVPANLTKFRLLWLVLERSGVDVCASVAASEGRLSRPPYATVSERSAANVLLR